MVNSLGDGLLGSPSSTASNDEKLLWDMAHQALVSSEVLQLLVQEFSPLKSTFDLLANIVEGIQVMKLTNSSSGGIYRLLEEFDVIPSYLSMKEAKLAFSLIISVQVFKYQRILTLGSWVCRRREAPKLRLRWQEEEPALTSFTS